MSHIQRAVMALGMVVAWIPSSASWAQQDSPEILSERSHYDINVEYAKTRVQLAETELQLALESNRRTPGAVARMAVERLKSNLSIAEQQFREAKLSTVGGEERVRLRHVEEKIRLAKLDLENA